MHFPNAQIGIKRLFTAEILGLIGAVLLVITVLAALITIVASAGASEGAVAGAALGAAGGGLATTALFAASFILNILGINSASKDEPIFKKSLMWLVIGIVLSLLGGFFKGSAAEEVFSLVTSICRVLSIYYILSGIISLADKMGDSRVAETAKKAIKLIITTQIIGVVIEAIGIILRLINPNNAAGAAFTLIAAVLGLIGAVVTLIAYVFRVKALYDAKNMLTEY